MNGNIFNPEDLGVIIRSARKAQGLTQDDLAGMTGTGRRVISDIEKGKPTSQIGKVLLILSTLGIALNVSSKWNK